MNTIEELKKLISQQQDTITRLVSHLASLYEDNEGLRVKCTDYVSKMEKMCEEIVSLKKVFEEVKDEMARVKEEQKAIPQSPVLPPGLPQHPVFPPDTIKWPPTKPWDGVWCGPMIGPGLRTETVMTEYPTTGMHLGNLGAGTDTTEQSTNGMHLGNLGAEG